jgi:hypothetical protein
MQSISQHCRKLYAGILLGRESADLTHLAGLSRFWVFLLSCMCDYQGYEAPILGISSTAPASPGYP